MGLAGPNTGVHSFQELLRFLCHRGVFFFCQGTAVGPDGLQGCF